MRGGVQLGAVLAPEVGAGWGVGGVGCWCLGFGVRVLGLVEGVVVFVVVD